MLSFVKLDPDPKVLIITPLRETDSIDRRTIESVPAGCGAVPVHWASYKGPGNVAANTNAGIRAYMDEIGSLPRYVIKIDNDIVDPGTHAIEHMVRALDDAPRSVAYSYVGILFYDEATKSVKANIPSVEFDADRLRSSNYISSNSMVRSTVLEDVGLFVEDDKYVRLLDWAFWLKLLSLGYIGEAACGGSLIALWDESSVSAGSAKDYVKKMRMVKKDFIEEVNQKGECL